MSEKRYILIPISPLIDFSTIKMINSNCVFGGCGNLWILMLKKGRYRKYRYLQSQKRCLICKSWIAFPDRTCLNLAESSSHFRSSIKLILNKLRAALNCRIYCLKLQFELISVRQGRVRNKLLQLGGNLKYYRVVIGASLGLGNHIQLGNSRLARTLFPSDFSRWYDESDARNCLPGPVSRSSL